MRPVRLQIAGLRSWITEREIQFEDVDLAAVVGPTGAGKSSLLEAIVYALYNTSTYERRAGSLISSDAKTMTVTLDFDADGERWRATRATSRTNYPPSVHKLACLSNPADHPLVEGEQPVNEAIEELVGLDRDQFLTAVLLPQGRFQPLLVAAPRIRSAILKGVFRLDVLDELRDRATRMRRDEIEPTLDAKRDERASLLPDPEETLAQANEEIQRCTTELTALTEINVRYNEITASAAALREEVAGQRRHADSVETLADATPSLESAIELDVELAGDESELQSLRKAQQNKRTAAQAAISAAAESEVTIESLVAARQTVSRARTSLPALDIDAERLQSALELHTGQQASLVTDQEKLGAQRQLLDASQGALSDLSEKADKARANATEAREKLHLLRAAVKQREQAQGQLAQLDQALVNAQAGTEQAARDAAAARGAADGAQAVVEEVRAAHQAAHLAAGLKPGEPCPICQRDLPTGFKAPKTPTVLAAAEAEAARLRTAQEEATSNATREAARVDGLKEQAKAGREALASAERGESDARTAADPYFADLDLTQTDDDLLSDLTATATAASAGYMEASHKAAAAEAQITTAEKGLLERSNTLKQRDKELGQESERIGNERKAVQEALDALPKEYRPKTTAPSDLEQIEAGCSSRLSELRQLQEQVTAATADLEKIDARVAVAAKRRADEIDAPRREAVAHAREIVLKLRDAETSVTIAKQPADSAALDVHAVWIAAIVKLARYSVKETRAQAAAGDDRIKKAVKEAATTLKKAAKVAGRELQSVDELQRELENRRATLIAAERLRDTATGQISRAAKLTESITQLIRRRDALEELAGSLGDGHFIRWLVDRRQQLLLAVASEILAEITDDRYRFAADFTIIDGRTGVARPPTTLSGGESFMASLSLALGMAEIAARGGGRIGSLYLDEGFGTLDPNALDEAITALEVRARSGQMILIVSHVPAIAERIGRVLRITPEVTGANAEWLDDTDRDSLLLEAAAQVGNPVD